MWGQQLVAKEGLEPTCPKAPAFEAGASACSATWPKLRRWGDKLPLVLPSVDPDNLERYWMCSNSPPVSSSTSNPLPRALACLLSTPLRKLVGLEGVEPSCLSASDFKSDVYAIPPQPQKLFNKFRNLEPSTEPSPSDGERHSGL